MPTISHTQSLAQKRKLRIRSKLFGTTQRPRLSIHRTNKHTYLQVVDDEKMLTVAAANDAKATVKGTKTERALDAAKNLAAQLSKKGIKALVIDRGSLRYHGRVRAVAEAMRTAGLEV